MRTESYPSKGNFLFIRKSARTVDGTNFHGGKPITGGESIITAVVFWTNKQETSLARRRRRERPTSCGRNNTADNPVLYGCCVQFSDPSRDFAAGTLRSRTIGRIIGVWQLEKYSRRNFSGIVTIYFDSPKNWWILIGKSTKILIRSIMFKIS